MADVFKLTGSYSADAGCGGCSGEIAEISGELSERVSLTNKTVGKYALSADAAVPVELGGLSQVNVLIVKAKGGKVRVRITSADGALQSIPVDTLLVLVDLTVPITAIDLTRVAGVTTSVQVFLGERT